jgi:hypothetical protein
MDTAHTVTVLALTLFLFEGFTLSVFPTQLQNLLAEADPRMLQVAGLLETVVAAGLLAVLMAA